MGSNRGSINNDTIAANEPTNLLFHNWCGEVDDDAKDDECKDEKLEEGYANWKVEWNMKMC